MASLGVCPGVAAHGGRLGRFGPILVLVRMAFEVAFLGVLAPSAPCRLAASGAAMRAVEILSLTWVVVVSVHEVHQGRYGECSYEEDDGEYKVKVGINGRCHVGSGEAAGGVCVCVCDGRSEIRINLG